MADAFARILGQKLPEGLDPDAGPVLAQRKTKQMKEQEAEKSERKRMRTDRAAKKALKEVGLHTPDFRDIEQERMLRRVATRGVVALFNAIAKQQHALDAGDVEDAVGSARDVKQLAKDNFIQMLKGREKGGGAAAVPVVVVLLLLLLLLRQGFQEERRLRGRHRERELLAEGRLHDGAGGSPSRTGSGTTRGGAATTRTTRMMGWAAASAATTTTTRSAGGATRMATAARTMLGHGRPRRSV